MRTRFGQTLVSLMFLQMLTGFVSAQTMRVNPDSAFWQLSLPELQSYRGYYVQELESRQEEKRNLIQRGIEDGERLLAVGPDQDVIDDILIRLADLYYYKEKDDYFNEMATYDLQLSRYEQDQISELPEEPRLVCDQSLSIYQRIIDEFPQSDLVDDAIYNKAFLYEEMVESEKANQIYLHLIDAYPQSPYIPEAYMRLAEHFFNPPVNDLTTAIDYYEKVLEYKDSPRYDEAMYKLGWSYYRLTQYPEAISYFTLLIENFKTVQKFDPKGLDLRTDLRDEAIDYIAISFIDFGGPAKARQYLNGIDDPEWGEQMLERLGDIYKDEKEDYLNAVAAFKEWLIFRPHSARAPQVQGKIVACYQILNDKANAYSARQDLFETYKPDGDWWERTEDDKNKLEAYRLAEEALRENINTLIRQAEETSRRGLYEKAVELGLEYLETFPEDIHSYKVRWNNAIILDTKLQRYKEALQEYLTISMVYNENKYNRFAREMGLSTIKDASENAVVVADSLVQREYRQNRTGGDGRKTSNPKDPNPLTTAESWLAMAYDNYIRLFPFDQNTPTILANAGALYYGHNQFDEALKYFRTLVKYFPKSDQIQNVQLSILESYFGNQDYESAEILAKRIIEESTSEEIRGKAKKRLGEAIFLKAQVLAEAGKSSEAADEYYRMALEAGTVEFVDRALFNAAREYERSEDYPAAIRAYESLKVTHSESPLLLDALNNLAFDYGEIGKHREGAKTYEDLAEILDDEDAARDALYNARVFYEKAEDWQKAIEMGTAFASRYPDAVDAPMVYMKTAEYHQNGGDFVSVARVYESFPERFPESPLAIEAMYRLGEYYSDIDSLEAAENAFYRAFEQNAKLEAAGIEGNRFFAAEGLFRATRMLHERYNRISFRLPLEEQQRSMARKESLLNRLVDQYTKVIAFETYRLPESIFSIGEAYENYALTWSNQDVPWMDLTERAVKEREINNRTTQIYNEALTAYLKAIEVLGKVAEETIASASSDPPGTQSREDSLVTLTNRWLTTSKEKVSETLYWMAEVNQRSIERLMSVPVPGDLEGMARLEYRSQVLVRAIKPLLDVVAEAHQRNLHVADSLGLNNTWTDASKTKLLAALNFLGREFEHLSFDGLSEYRYLEDVFRRVVFDSVQEPPGDVTQSMINFIEVTKTYTEGALKLCNEANTRALESGVPVPALIESQDELIRFALGVADTLENLIRISTENQSQARTRFEETGDLIYEDALASFEDNAYFLNENLKSILELAYETKEGFRTHSALGGWLAVRLLRLDPDVYTERFKIPVQEMIVRTDTTWMYTTDYQKGWDLLGFDAAGWRRAVERADSGAAQNANRNLQIYGLPAEQGESSFYVRKIIEVPGFPVLGRMYFRTDQSNRFFLNNTPISGSMERTPVDMTSLLKEGKNLLAMECQGARMFSIGGAALIRYVPRQALPNREY